MRKLVYLLVFALFAVGIYVFLVKKELKAPETPVAELPPAQNPAELPAPPSSEVPSESPKVSVTPSEGFGQLSDFTFTDQLGHEFRLSNMKGNVLVLSFFFTKCQGPCPILNKKLEALQEKFATEAKIKLVSVSVDPTNDTVEVLKTYSEGFKANPEKWFFLSGTKETVADLMEKQLKFAGGDPQTHTTVFVLVNQDASIKGFYDSMSEEDLARLEKDALQLASSSAS